MEYIILLSFIFIGALGIVLKALRKANEELRNLYHANVVLNDEFEAELAVLRAEPVNDPRTIFEKTLADFHNPSLIEEMYVACPAEDCRREYLRIDKPVHICRECGTSFYDLPTAA